MNRACYFLAPLLTAWVAFFWVSPARCQSHGDYCRFGIGVNDVCPFVDGYTEVDKEEAACSALDQKETDELDLQGRSVVAVLEDVPDYDCGYDYYYGIHYSGTRSYGPWEAWEDATASTAIEQGTDIAPPALADVVERDYEQECYAAYLQRCAAEAETLADAPVLPVLLNEMEEQAQPQLADVVERDYEQECYAAYLQHCAEEAQRLADAPATSAEVANSQSYEAYGYGYTYAYEYDYLHRYHACPAILDPDEAVDAGTPGPEPLPQLDVLAWVDCGREFCLAMAGSDLVKQVRAEADQLAARVVLIATRVDLATIYQDASNALVNALHRSPSDVSAWTEANVFLFVFESDLNAEPLAVTPVASLPPSSESVEVSEVSPCEPHAALEQPLDGRVTMVGPWTREQLGQWTRKMAAAGVEAWEVLSVALRQLAEGSLALLAQDDLGSSTHR